MPLPLCLACIRLVSQAMNTGEPAFAAWLDIEDQHFPLVGKTFSLGRTKDNNVVFASPKVSRRHALVHAQGGSEFSLVDLGSSNGTHLNGRRVIQPTSLQHGDVIQIGEQSLTFRLEQAQAADEQIYVTEAQMTVRDVNELICWFLLMDVENFVKLGSEMSPAQLAQTVGTWLGECQRVVEKNGGTLSKFLGDGVLVYWNDKFCDRAKLVAALDALCAMQSRRQPPFRWTLHYGKAIFGTPVPTSELSTLGQDLNFLFRMERLAATEKLPNLISGAAQAELTALRRCQTIGPFSLKGFEDEFWFYRWNQEPVD